MKLCENPKQNKKIRPREKISELSGCLIEMSYPLKYYT